MLTAKELLNKIKWDPREDPSEYEIVYYDRIENKERSISFLAIEKIEGNFIRLLQGTEIPIHRIRKIKKSGKVVWKRQPFISER